MNNVRILLVEDEAPKRTHIMRFLTGLGSGIAVTEARSVNSALDALELDLPDLLILDMSLPTFDVGGQEGGGRPQGLGGIEILRHMSLSGISCPTIVITGYEAFPRDAGKPVELFQVRAELMAEFSEFLRRVLHYNSTYDEWKVELAKAIAEVGLLPKRNE